MFKFVVCYDAWSNLYFVLIAFVFFLWLLYFDCVLFFSNILPNDAYIDCEQLHGSVHIRICFFPSLSLSLSLCVCVCDCVYICVCAMCACVGGCKRLWTNRVTKAVDDLELSYEIWGLLHFFLILYFIVYYVFFLFSFLYFALMMYCLVEWMMIRTGLWADLTALRFKLRFWWNCLA